MDPRKRMHSHRAVARIGTRHALSQGV